MNKKSKQITWWITGVVAFLIFVLLQVPATWLISKFYKNNQTLQNVSGNIWQGQADWRRVIYVVPFRGEHARGI